MQTDICWREVFKMTWSCCTAIHLKQTGMIFLLRVSGLDWISMIKINQNSSLRLKVCNSITSETVMVVFQTTLIAAGINCIPSGTSMLRRKWAFWTGMHLIFILSRHAETFFRNCLFHFLDNVTARKKRTLKGVKVSSNKRKEKTNLPNCFTPFVSMAIKPFTFHVLLYGPGPIETVSLTTFVSHVTVAASCFYDLAALSALSLAVEATPRHFR